LCFVSDDLISPYPEPDQPADAIDMIEVMDPSQTKATDEDEDTETGNAEEVLKDKEMQYSEPDDAMTLETGRPDSDVMEHGETKETDDADEDKDSETGNTEEVLKDKEMPYAEPDDAMTLETGQPDSDVMEHGETKQTDDADKDSETGNAEEVLKDKEMPYAEPDDAMTLETDQPDSDVMEHGETKQTDDADKDLETGNHQGICAEETPTGNGEAVDEGGSTACDEENFAV